MASLQMFPVIPLEAGGGGDCFYYSLWSALTERDLIRQIFYNRYNIPIPIEKEQFMLYMRHYVYKTLLDDLDKEKKIEGMYNFISDLKGEIMKILPPAYKSVSRFLHPGNDIPKLVLNAQRPRMNALFTLLKTYEFQEWLVDFFLQSRTKEEFKLKVLERVRLKGTYIQSFESNIINDLFKKVGIEIKYHYDDQLRDKLPMINEKGEQILHLLVMTKYIGGHFQYYSFMNNGTVPQVSVASATQARPQTAATSTSQARPSTAAAACTSKACIPVPPAKPQETIIIDDDSDDELERRFKALKERGGKKSRRKNKNNKSKKGRKNTTVSKKKKSRGNKRK